MSVGGTIFSAKTTLKNLQIIFLKMAGYELEIFDISLRKNKPYYETESIDFDDDAIGKSIFLTREEAEHAFERRC